MTSTTLSTPSPGELSVRLIATGLLKLAERAEPSELSHTPSQAHFPYPPQLMRGLNHLAGWAIERGEEAPRSVSDLLRLCRRPLEQWPLDLDGVDGEATLLDGWGPTNACLEWACDASDVEAEVTEQALMRGILTACRAADAPSTYVHARRLLIERPVMTRDEMLAACTSSELALLAEHLELAYAPAPAACLDSNGEFRLCPTCNSLLVRSAGVLRCEEERCRAREPRLRAGKTGKYLGRVLAAREGGGVLWLRRGLRRFVAGPNVLLLSGTSWAGESRSFHLQTPVSGVLAAPPQEVRAIEGSRFEFWPQRNAHGRPIHISGRSGEERAEALREMLRALAAPNLGASILERERDSLPQDRRHVLLLVNSYEQAREATEFLLRLRPEWRGQVLRLVSDDDEDVNHLAGDEPNHLRRGAVSEFARTGAWLLVAPLGAIERGHNILTRDGSQAAIGAAFFLVRPHPRPDDPTFAIHSINHWAVRCRANLDLVQDDEGDWEAEGQELRRAAYRKWRGLLGRRVRLASLPEDEREALTWSLVVSVWQVIGRLVRGGSPARVFFCDAAWAPQSAAGNFDTPHSSLLVAMRHLLRPYFCSANSRSESILVQRLYGPFHHALENILGLDAEGVEDVQEAAPAFDSELDG